VKPRMQLPPPLNKSLCYYLLNPSGKIVCGQQNSKLFCKAFLSQAAGML
jgi:hypothetical protein